MSVQSDQRTLSLNDIGDDVRRLQNFLNNFDFGSIAEDGVFGSDTEDAVKRYQSDRGLSADGIVGSDTWARINHDLS